MLCVAQPIRAQDAETSALARSLFEEGARLADAGDREQAVDRFRRSLELRPSAVVAFNLAQVDGELGHVVEACELLRRALRDTAIPRRLRDAAERLLAELAPRVGSLTITLEGSREGVDVLLDDARVPEAALGVVAPIDPGPHLVVARRAEVELARREITIGEGASDTVVLDLPPPPEPPPVLASPGPTAVELAVRAPAVAEPPRAELPPAALPPAATTSSSDAAPWIAFGIGAGVIAIAAITVVVLFTATDVGNPAPEPPIMGTLRPGVVEFP